MKHIISIVIVLLLLPMVLAISAGQTFTQEQINNFDTDQINPTFLQCVEGDVDINLLYIRKNFQCLNLEKDLDDGAVTYTVYVDDGHVDIPYWQAKYCVDHNSLAYCQEQFRHNVIDGFDVYLNATVGKVKSWQQPEIPQSWLDWLNDIFGGF